MTPEEQQKANDEYMAELDKLWGQLFSLGKSFNQSINEIIEEKKASEK